MLRKAQSGLTSSFAHCFSLLFQSVVPPSVPVHRFSWLFPRSSGFHRSYLALPPFCFAAALIAPASRRCSLRSCSFHSVRLRLLFFFACGHRTPFLLSARSSLLSRPAGCRSIRVRRAVVCPRSSGCSTASSTDSPFRFFFSRRRKTALKEKKASCFFYG